ncbi:polysaccharide synthase [Colletotrichum chrysophilum]|uniref:Polysaccharide synthase n=1 Tax=Colletotrichum chrysophilum TaxID=1836956 RepID=A0AAD9EKD6_9PEZI|nr:polysaccharide synthase [Colletotrichum chrysophilum]
MVTTIANYTLGGLWMYYLLEEDKTKRLAEAYTPIPLPDEPTYNSSDVSIIVPTINTPDEFTDCLRLWLTNQPKEIIIVTIERDLQRVYDLVRPVVTEGDERISLMTADVANKREQLLVGIKHAKGKILALVDDDAFWKCQVLPHLLAPFEDPKVGGAVGKQSAHFPVCRRNPNVITPWEVASLRSLENQNNVQAVRFAADGSVFCLVGRTLMMRAEIAQDPRFQYEITHEYWCGKRQNTGDDVFITRWLVTEGWKMSIQNAPEAEITTLVMRDSALLRQMVRWQRNAIQSFLVTVVYKPGLLQLYKKHPYMARKLIERLLRPIIAWVHIIAFIVGVYQKSPVAYFVGMWYLLSMIATYRDFVRRYPWAEGHLGAAILLDICYPVVDVYSWLTLSTEAWGTRNENA